MFHTESVDIEIYDYFKQFNYFVGFVVLYINIENFF